jgi:hypothetical protein
VFTIRKLKKAARAQQKAVEPINYYYKVVPVLIKHYAMKAYGGSIYASSANKNATSRDILGEQRPRVANIFFSLHDCNYKKFTSSLDCCLLDCDTLQTGRR